MRNLIKIIYDYSKKGKVVNKDFIYHALNTLINEKFLNDYVLRIKILNFNRAVLATYCETSKTIYVNYQKLIYCVSTYISSNVNVLNYQDRFLIVNIYILKILLHELEHVIQVKKIDISKNSESKLLLISNEWEQILKNEEMKKYNQQLYEVNPLERQATLISYKKIREACQEIENKNAIIFFKKEYLSYAFKNYISAKNMFPAKIYFANFPDKNLIKKTIELFEKEKFNLRFDLGLNISEEEYLDCNAKVKLL